MQIVAVLPVKSLADAKSRLAGELSLEQRRALVLTLMERLLRVLAASRAVTGTLVVSPDPSVLAHAAAAGAHTLAQRIIPASSGTSATYSDGLNQALIEARQHIRAAQALLVLLADLPLITPADIVAMCGLLPPEGPAAVIAPDRHEQGTNALLLRPPEALAFSFGTGSLAQHIRAAQAAKLSLAFYRAPGTAFDLDTAADLRELDHYRQAMRCNSRVSRQSHPLTSSLYHLYNRYSGSHVPKAAHSAYQDRSPDTVWKVSDG